MTNISLYKQPRLRIWDKSRSFILLTIIEEYICQNTVRKIDVSIEEGEVWTEDCQENELKDRVLDLKQKTRLSHLEDAVAAHIWKGIASYHDIFHLEEYPLPCTNLVEHEIILKSGKVINTKPYRLLECDKEESYNQIEELYKKRVIRGSNSPCNSSIWVVAKKKEASGKQKWRIVIDFRKINEDTDQDAYPLPAIDDILDHLENAKFFSAFDLGSRFHQIPMAEESKKYTGFSTTDGHFEFNRMPFGLNNSPATFLRMMHCAPKGLNGKICFVYLDDIDVFGTTLEIHNNNLMILFERLRPVGLKLQPNKCEYLRPELEYLGHLITAGGIKPNPVKIHVVRETHRIIAFPKRSF